MTASRLVLPRWWIRVPIAVKSGARISAPCVWAAAMATRTGPPRAVHQRPVVLRKIFALTEDRQAHHMKIDVNISDLLDLEYPA